MPQGRLAIDSSAAGGPLTGVALNQISVWIPYGAKKATRKWPKSLILWRARLESNQ